MAIDASTYCSSVTGGNLARTKCIDSTGKNSCSRIAELARQDAGRKFYSIAHLLTKEALWEAFDNLRKDAAAGVDGVTSSEYEEHLVENLGKLHEKLKRKTYRAQPLRRIYIDKEDGRKRPISIPSLEDKIVQRATVELLNAIFEQGRRTTADERDGDRSGAEHQPAAGQHLPAPRSGYVVRGRGEAALERQSVRDPLCR
jgi:hypothetical protein